LTHALLLSIGRNCSSVVPRLLSSLQEQKTNCDQPMLLVLLSTEQVIDDFHERIGTSDEKLGDIEEAMGQHEDNDRLKGNPLEIDFVATTSALNHISKMLANHVSRLASVLIALERISEWKEGLVENQSDPKGAENVAAIEEISNSICMADEKIAYLTDRCCFLRLRAEYEEKRTRSLIQVV
jgi:hypothetical protein